MTTRGCVEKDFVEIMKLVDRAVSIVNAVNKKSSGKKLKDFKDTLKEDLAGNAEIQKIRNDINSFSQQFPVPGGLL
jgi:glycine hydroxymethyltransferase